MTLIIKWMSILANPLQEYIYPHGWVFANQITLIIKWMSIRANVSILANPLSRIYIKGFYFKNGWAF